MRLCAVCARAIDQPTEQGRPRLYCGDGCREIHRRFQAKALKIGLDTVADGRYAAQIMADRANAYTALRDAESDPGVSDYLNDLAIAYADVARLHSSGAPRASGYLHGDSVAELIPDGI